MNGNVADPNTAMPLPNNLDQQALSPAPSTFAATPPARFGNQTPATDNHAGHSHANHNHSDHDHANHSHSNQQHDQVAQAGPRIAGPALTQPLEKGHAQVLQNDSPLMSGGEQLGSIDRGQVLRILNIQGNWVQLDTNWLGKNAWIRKDLIQMNGVTPQASEDVAPLAN